MTLSVDEFVTNFVDAEWNLEIDGKTNVMSIRMYFHQYQALPPQIGRLLAIYYMYQDWNNGYFVDKDNPDTYISITDDNDEFKGFHPIFSKILFQELEKPISKLSGVKQALPPPSSTDENKVSASLMMQILAHPATKAITALFLVAGLIGLTIGTMGLGGLLGLSVSASTILIGVGSGSMLTGIGLAGFGLFASSKINEGDTLDCACFSAALQV